MLSGAAERRNEARLNSGRHLFHAAGGTTCYKILLRQSADQNSQTGNKLTIELN